MNTAIAKNIPPETKAWIIQAIQEVLEDPDFGLELTEQAKKRLRRMRNPKSLRGKSVSSTDIIRKYG